MKLTPLILVPSMVGSLQAYTVAIANILNADETAVPILLPDSTQVPIGEGSVTAGYFKSLGVADLQVVDFDLLMEDFVQFGGSDSESPIAFDVGAPGFFDVAMRAPIPQGSDNEFTNEKIFVFIGNEVALEDSSSFALYDSGQVFGEDNQLGLGGTEVIIVDPVEGLIRGTNAGPVDIGVGFPLSSAIVLEKVPEPSSTLLVLFSLTIPVCIRRSRSARS